MNEHDRIAAGLQQTGLADIVRANPKPNGIALVCRVHRKEAWLGLIEYMLLNKTCWDEHICQQYFIREGRLVYCWNLIFNAHEGTSIVKMVEEILRLIQGAPRQRQVVSGPIMSFPLIGASPDRDRTTVFDPRLPGPGRGGPRQKGAHSIKAGD
jgi:hypothetical protein